MWIKVAVKADKRDVKETRCHLETIEVPLEENRYLRSFNLVRKCILPSGSLCSNLNRLHSYYWKEKPRSFYLRRAHRVFQALTHDPHTGFHNLRYEGTRYAGRQTLRSFG